MEAFKKGCAGFLPKLCEMVEEEAEYSVVVSALDGIAEMLKHCKTGATSIDKIPELIVQCVSKIMKKECACQVCKCFFQCCGCGLIRILKFENGTDSCSAIRKLPKI